MLKKMCEGMILTNMDTRAPNQNCSKTAVFSENELIADIFVELSRILGELKKNAQD